jgi:hypothetical protein
MPQGDYLVRGRRGLPSLADLGLDEDMCGNHLARPPNLVGPGRVECRVALVGFGGDARSTSRMPTMTIAMAAV